MLRIFNSVIRSSLHSSWCAVIPSQLTQCCGLKQTIEEKLNIPPKPKRPLSPFFRFMIDTRPAMKQKYPNASVIEISTLISKEWENVDYNVKADMEKNYRKEFDHYSRKLSEYTDKLSPEQVSAVKIAKVEKYLASKQRKLRKKCKLLGKPLKPKSTFLQFLQDNKLSRGTMDVTEWVKSMAQKWQELDEREKQQYIDQAKKNMEKYAEDMREWEVEMIKSGHSDVVKKESQMFQRSPPVKDRK